MSEDRIYDEKIDGAASTIKSCMDMGAVILKPKDAPTFGFGNVHKQPEASTRES